jgi:hypothetical protein
MALTVVKIAIVAVIAGMIAQTSSVLSQGRIYRVVSLVINILSTMGTGA